MDGSFPHLGEISLGFNGHTSLPFDEVHAKNRFDILMMSPQLYVIVPKSNEVVAPPGIGPAQPVLTVDNNKDPSKPL